MTTKIDFTALTLKQLVAEYNTYTGNNRTSLFQNKAEGVAMVTAAHEAWLARQTIKKADKVIVVNATEVRGQIAQNHFVVVQKSKTLGDYLSQFEQGAVRSYARAWLRLFANKGLVTLKAA